MSKILLALDQSTAVTGWALFIDEKLERYGVFSPSGDYLERIAKLCNWVLTIIKHYNKELKIAIEDIQLQEIGGVKSPQNVVTFKKLAHAQGALLEIFHELEIPYEIVCSSSWKSSCNIKGTKRAEQKKNAQKFVLDKYNINVTEDEADAICLGLHTLKNEPFEW